MKTQAEAFDWISVLRESKRKKEKKVCKNRRGSLCWKRSGNIGARVNPPTR